MTPITNDELGKFRLSFSRCANLDIAPLAAFNHLTFLAVAGYGNRIIIPRLLSAFSDQKARDQIKVYVIKSGRKFVIKLSVRLRWLHTCES